MNKTQNPATPVELENALNKIAAFSAESDIVLTLDGPLSVTVGLKDGTYRNVPMSRQDFFLAGFRMGAGNKPILIFRTVEEPVFSLSDHERKYGENFAHTEVAISKVDSHFPDASKLAVEWCRKATENDGDDLMAVTLDTVETFEDGLGMMIDILRREGREAAAQQEQELKANPLFGMF